MQKPNPVQEKSFSLALAIVQICRALQEKREFIISKQVLRSGTSVGANIAEAPQAQSRKDFIAKLSIAHKEAFETDYWLRLLSDSKYLDEKELKISKCLLREVMALLTAILKKTKQNS